MVKASVILSFYNKIDYLKLVLAGFERQTFNDFEVIIADDGSSGEVISGIENLSTKLPF
ncbi:MAG: glycosyltransferase, partial [Ignavibacteriaceae bacterium]